jgi:hypothetical protein
MAIDKQAYHDIVTGQVQAPPFAFVDNLGNIVEYADIEGAPPVVAADIPGNEAQERDAEAPASTAADNPNSPNRSVDARCFSNVACNILCRDGLVCAYYSTEVLWTKLLRPFDLI